MEEGSSSTQAAPEIGSINREPLTTEDRTTPSSSEKDKEKKDDSNSIHDSTFECNICLETAVEPVISMCGHLFCWPCIYQWIELHGERPCPVCKSAVSKDQLIPLYGRGKEKKDPRNQPPRPQGHRTETNPNNFQHNFGSQFPSPFGGPTFQTDNFSFSVGFGFFPSLFGFQYGTLQHQPTASDQQQLDNAMFSRLFVLMGIFAIVCLLTF